MSEHDGTGHVVNAGGAPSACGGPTKCPTCARNMAALMRKGTGMQVEQGPMVWEAIAGLLERVKHIEAVQRLGPKEAGRAAWNAKIDERAEREARDARIDAAARRGGVPDAADIYSLLKQADPAPYRSTTTLDEITRAMSVANAASGVLLTGSHLGPSNLAQVEIGNLQAKVDEQRGQIQSHIARAADLARQNSDLQAANNALLKRARDAEALIKRAKWHIDTTRDSPFYRSEFRRGWDGCCSMIDAALNPANLPEST